MSEEKKPSAGLWTKDLGPDGIRWSFDSPASGTQWQADVFENTIPLEPSTEVTTPIIYDFELPGVATVYINENFDDLTEAYSASNVPSGWSTSTSNIIYGVSNTAGQRMWEPESGTTLSTATGPVNAHGNSDSSGAFSGSGISNKYMYTEVSGAYGKNFLLRTSELDFSNSRDNNTLQLTFWFHMHGSVIGELMIGTSNSATSANNGTIGTGFSDEADGASRTGMSIEFWNDASDDGSSTSTAIVIEGQQQSEGHTSTNQAAYWRKATVNLNAVAGEASCYIWFYSKSGTSFRGDICIDSVKVYGEE